MKRGDDDWPPGWAGWHSLRRRTDKIAAYGVLGLLVVFLVSAPVLSVFAGHWADRAFASAQQHERAWREVAAVPLQAAPLEPGNYDVSKSWARVKWHPPAGHAQEGTITATAGTPAGAAAPRIPVDGSGQWAGAAAQPAGGRVRVAAAVVVTTLMPRTASGQCRVLRPVVARSMSAGRPTGIRSDRGGPDSSGSAGSRFVGGRFTVMVRPEASRAAALDGR